MIWTRRINPIQVNVQPVYSFIIIWTRRINHLLRLPIHSVIRRAERAAVGPRIPRRVPHSVPSVGLVADSHAPGPRPLGAKPDVLQREGEDVEPGDVAWMPAGLDRGHRGGIGLVFAP